MWGRWPQAGGGRQGNVPRTAGRDLEAMAHDRISLGFRTMEWGWLISFVLWGLLCFTLAFILPITKTIKDIRKIAANERAGIYAGTDLVKRIWMTYLLTCIVYLSQTALVCVLFFVRVTSIGWIGISIFFIASTFAFWRAKTLRGRLLKQALR